MRWLLASLLILAVYQSYCQDNTVYWKVNDSGAQMPIFTHKTTYLLQLNIDLPSDTPEGWKVKMYRNGQVYTPINQKMGEVKLGKPTQTQGLSLIQEVDLEVGDNVWEAEVKSPDGRLFRTKPIRIVHKTGKPSLYLLCVGVPYDLKYTQNDATALFSKFKTQEGLLFGKVEGQVLVCDQDTKFTKLGQTLSDLRYQSLSEEDVLILFFSSHGMASKAFGQLDFGLVSNDAGEGVTDERYVLFFYQKDIIQNIRHLRCKRLVLLDACHSGAARGDKNWIGTFDEAQDAIKNTPSGIVSIASSSGSESSFEHPTWKHGAFTYSLLEGLSGKADLHPKDNNITVLELSDYLKKRVSFLVDSVFHKPQNPYLVQSPEQDFPLFNYARLNKGVAFTPMPCESNTKAPDNKKVLKISVMSILPNQSEFDWDMNKEAVSVLQKKLSTFQILQGDATFVKNGTAIALLDGYPPPHLNLASQTNAEYLCISTRKPTIYQQSGSKWIATIACSFTFVNTHSKMVTAKESFETEGEGATKQQAEKIAITKASKKLSQVQITF